MIKYYYERRIFIGIIVFISLLKILINVIILSLVLYCFILVIYEEKNSVFNKC